MYVCHVYREIAQNPDVKPLRAKTLVVAEQEAEVLTEGAQVQLVELWSEGVLLRRGRPIDWRLNREG